MTIGLDSGSMLSAGTWACAFHTRLARTKQGKERWHPDCARRGFFGRLRQRAARYTILV